MRRPAPLPFWSEPQAELKHSRLARQLAALLWAGWPACWPSGYYWGPALPGNCPAHQQLGDHLPAHTTLAVLDLPGRHGQRGMRPYLHPDDVAAQDLVKRQLQD